VSRHALACFRRVAILETQKQADDPGRRRLLLQGRKTPIMSTTLPDGSQYFFSENFASSDIDALAKEDVAPGEILPMLMAKMREDEPTKYWLSTLPKNIPFRDLVDAAKLRWRIERDYQELKQEVGLGHFEGRGWRGFHHHATLCIAAYPMFDISGVAAGDKSLILLMWGCDFRQNVGTDIWMVLLNLRLQFADSHGVDRGTGFGGGHVPAHRPRRRRPRRQA
jgi:hypothetical protein